MVATDAMMERLQATLRGLAFGADPTRLLHEALAGAMAATKGREGVLMRLANGSLQSVASTGSAGQYLADAARDAVTSERPVRRRDTESGLIAAAEPIRAGSRVLGVLAIGGPLSGFDAAH